MSTFSHADGASFDSSQHAVQQEQSAVYPAPTTQLEDLSALPKKPFSAHLSLSEIFDLWLKEAGEPLAELKRAAFDWYDEDSASLSPGDRTDEAQTSHDLGAYLDAHPDHRQLIWDALRASAVDQQVLAALVRYARTQT